MTTRPDASRRPGTPTATLREVVLIFPVYAIMMGEHGVSPIELSILFFVWSAARSSSKCRPASSPIVTPASACSLPPALIRGLRVRRLVAGARLHRLPRRLRRLEPRVEPRLGYVRVVPVRHAASSAGHGSHDGAFARIYGRGMVANSLGVATALLGGGYLAESGYEWPLALSIARRGSPRRSSRSRSSNHRAAARRSAREPSRDAPRGSRRSARQPNRAYIVAMFAALVTGYGVVDEYVGPFLDRKTGVQLGIDRCRLRCGVRDAHVGMEARAPTAVAFVARHCAVVCSRRARTRGDRHGRRSMADRDTRRVFRRVPPRRGAAADAPAEHRSRVPRAPPSRRSRRWRNTPAELLFYLLIGAIAQALVVPGRASRRSPR